MLKGLHFRNILILLFILIAQKGFTQDTLPDSADINNIDSIAPDTSGIEANAPDSTKKTSNAIEAPIHYSATDSMVMILNDQNIIYLFKDSKVDYQSLSLTGEYIEIDAKTNVLTSTFGLDSIGDETGYPVFKDGDTEYEMKKARYNFKTKKMFITDVITQQGEGYVTASKSKKLENDDLFLGDVRYTTCDEHDHPHFYFQLSKAKVRPKKNMVSGPAYLVVEDVPLPIAIPFAFFPIKKDYSSGIIMPSFDDELRRGFSLRDGGYYFALSDYADLALTGEIFSKGSWGLKAQSSYRKRYKFTGNVSADYLVTVLGDKDADDYSKSTDFRLFWSHTQDAKAHPFRTFSASVNFATASYNKNSLNSQYSDLSTTNQTNSTINYSYRFPDSPFSVNATASVSQTSKNSEISATLPNITVNMRNIYPFRRKEQVGSPKWYENIQMSYSGSIKNSINTKEDEILKKSLLKDWKNGIKHSIPISATFNVFKYVSITPNISYNEWWYTSKIKKGYDYSSKSLVTLDTIYGFNRLFSFSGEISTNTKLYGFFKPWAIFGERAKNTVIRHVITPSVKFTGAPDFSDEKYGYYKDVRYYDENLQKWDTLNYSLYEHQSMGLPGHGKTARLSFSVDNNLEMKIPILGTDSTRKISLIDNFRFRSGYNFLADEFNWDDIDASIRLKLSKSYTFDISGTFDPYTYKFNKELYDQTGQKQLTRVNKTRWSAGKGIGRLMSTSTSFSYTLNNSVVKGWFSKGNKNDPSATDSGNSAEDGIATEDETSEEEQPRTSLRKKKKSDDKYDDDGYWLTNIPWSLSFNFGLGLKYDSSNIDMHKEEYRYEISPRLGIHGNISPTKNWAFNFNAHYDFEAKKIVRMNCTISRKMHCWQMSASFVPVGNYQSYHFTIAVNASMLKDLKYTQSGNSYDAMKWGNQ